MLELLLAPENIAFATALLLMLLIGIVEALGLGVSGLDAGEADIGGEAASPILHWLGFGRLPLLMALVVALAAFGLSGLVIQHIAFAWFGGLLPLSIAAPAALASALPLTALMSRAAAHILPADETSAVGLDTLVGRRGHVMLGIAERSSPARARIRDAFGHSHYVLVEPNLAGEQLSEGDEILIVARDASSFRAIAVAPHVTLEEGVAA